MDMDEPRDFVVRESRRSITTFNIRVADNLADFADLWPRTDRYGSAHCYAFQCADILQVWCDTVGKARGTRAVFVAVFDDIGQPILLLPLGIETRRHVIRVLRFLDGGVCDYNAPVVFAPTRTWDRATLGLLWRALIRALPRFDIAEFEKMPVDICGVPNPLLGLAVSRFADSGHFMSITGSWEEYAATHLPYKRDSSYQRRRLSRFGPLLFRVANAPEDRQRILDAMMRQKSQQYFETWGVDGLNRPGHRQYYTALVERLNWPGPLLVTALEIDKSILATNCGLVCNRRFLGLITAFDANEWKRFSPGRLLLEDLLRWTFTNGIRIFDFGIGDESYKLAYGDQTLPLYRAAIPVTVIGKAFHIGQSAKAELFASRLRHSNDLTARPEQ